MSISKTPHGTWRARIRDNSGRQVTKTFRFKADAEAWERTQLLDRDKGGVPIAATGTVAQWADQWLAISRDLAPSTIKTYRRDLDRYILPDIGNIKLKDLTTEHIDAMLNEHTARGLAASTVHRHRRTVRTMMAVAVKRNKLAVNVVDNVKPPRLPHKEMRFLTIEQLERLADNIGARYRAWALVAGYAGLRWAEMLAVTKGNFTGDVIYVDAQLVQVDGLWRRVPPKSASSRRRVPLPKSVGDALREHIDTYCPNGTPDSLVFTNNAGRPLVHPSFTGNVFKPALVRAGLDRNVRIHDLRHSAVAIAIQAGGHPKSIQMRFGHSSMKVTFDDYGHIMPDMESTLAADIDTLRINTLDTTNKEHPK